MIRITTLIENAQGEHKGLASEHGLSFHVQTPDGALLFDTGQSAAFMDNAAMLGIDITAVGHAVLSHGHYDHTGGLTHLAGRATGFELLVGRGFFAEKFSNRGQAVEFLGNSFNQAFLSGKGIACTELSEPLHEVLPGVYAITGFARTHPDEVVNPRFIVRDNGAFTPDMFDDEVCLAVDTAKGVIVLLGCSHPGVKNMLDAVRERLDKPIHTVVGGTHLVEASQASLRETVAYFQAKEIAAIGVSHCTGATAMGELAALTGRYFHNRTGAALVVT